MTAAPQIDSPYLTLTVAQEPQAPALAGGTTAPAAPGGGDGAGGDGAAAPTAAQPNFLILMLPLLCLFVFITFMSSRREKKRRQQLQQVTKHDRVRTRGGIIGSVVETNGDQLVIKVDEGRDTRITLDRSYIDAILEGAGSDK